MSWKVGLRIVDLGELARQMYCKECTSVLDLNRTESEDQFGLASVLKVVCQCGVANHVRTGRLVQEERHDEVLSYDINVKASIGLLAYSKGEKTVINFLSVLNIPATDLTLILSRVSKQRGGQHQGQGDKIGQGQATNEPQSHQVQVSTVNCSTSSDKDVLQEDGVKLKGHSSSTELSALVPNQQLHSTRRKRKLPVPGIEGENESQQTSAQQPKFSKIVAAGHTFTGADDQSTMAVESDELNVQEQTPVQGTDKRRLKDYGDDSQQIQPSTSASQLGHVKQEEKLREISDGGGEGERCTDKDVCAESADARADFVAGTGRTSTRTHYKQSKCNVNETQEVKSLACFSRKRLKWDQRLKERAKLEPSSREKVKQDQISEEKGILGQTSRKGREKSVSTRKKNQETVSSMHNKRRTESEHKKGFTANLSPVLLRLQTQKRLSNSRQGRKKSGTADVGKKIGQKPVTRQQALEKRQGRNVFKCPLCQRAVGSSRGLSAHLRQAHQHKPGKNQRGNKGKLTVDPPESSITTKGDKSRVQCNEEEGVVLSHNNEADQDDVIRHAHEDQHPAACVKQPPNVSSIPATHIGLTTKNNNSILSKKKPRKTHFACPQCNVRFAYSLEFTNHMQREHNVEKPHRCKRCSECFPTENQLKLHRKQHSPVEEFHECTVCLKIFPTGRRLRAHRATHTREERYRPLKRYRCEICGEEFAKNYFLQIHLNYHRGKKPYQCFLCEESFFTKPERRAHYKKCIAKKKWFLCELCGGRFGSVSSLRKHERVHSGEKPHQCRFCDKTFSRTNTLRIHERQHTGETPYVCDQCGSGFKQRVSLVTHMKSKHNINATYYSQPRSSPRYTHEDFLAGKPYAAKAKSDDDAGHGFEDFNSSVVQSDVTEAHQVSNFSTASAAAGVALPAMHESTSVQNQHAFLHTNFPLLIPSVPVSEMNKILTLAHAAKLLASASSMTQAPVFPHQFSARLQQGSEASCDTVQVQGSSRVTVVGVEPSLKIASAPQGISFTDAPESATTSSDCAQNATSSLPTKTNLNSAPSDGSVSSDFGKSTTNSGRISTEPADRACMLSDTQSCQEVVAPCTDRSATACQNSRSSNSSSSIHSTGVGGVARRMPSNRGTELSVQPGMDILQRDISVVLSTLQERGVVVNMQGERSVIVHTQGNRVVGMNTRGDRGVVVNAQGDKGTVVDTQSDRVIKVNTLSDRVMVVNTQGDTNMAVNAQVNKDTAVNAEGDRYVNTQEKTGMAVNLQGGRGAVIETQGDKVVAVNTGGDSSGIAHTEVDGGIVLNAQGNGGMALSTLGTTGLALSSERNACLVTGDCITPDSQGNQRLVLSHEILQSLGLNAQHHATPNSRDEKSDCSTIPDSDVHEEMSNKLSTSTVPGAQTPGGVAGHLNSDPMAGTEDEAGEFETQGDDTVASRLGCQRDEVVTVYQSQLTSLQNVPLYYNDN